MSVLAEIAAATRAAHAAAAPATVAIGRHARGAGVVIAQDRVLTSAHNLRDRTTQVTFADGRPAQGAVVGSDADRDVVVLDVPTDDVTPLTWSDGVDRGRRRGVRAGPHRRRRPHHRRRRLGRGPHLPRPPGAPGVRGGRAHRPPRPGFLGRAVGRCRGPPGGPQHPPPGGRLLPRPPRRRGAAGPGRCPGRRRPPPHPPPGHRDRARPPRRPPPRAGSACPRRPGLLIRAVAEGSPAAAAGLDEGDLLTAVDGHPVAERRRPVGRPRRRRRPASVEVTVLRGTDERTVTVTFPAEGVAEGGDDED